MKEVNRIRELIEEAYNGQPWLDVNLVDTLATIDAATAAKKVHPQLNTIWEIVNHMVAWRKTVLQRMKGTVIASPPDNFFTPVMDQSQAAWQETMEALKLTQQDWLTFLASSNDEELEQLYAGNQVTHYKNIQGIIQHDVYHLGQIVLLAKITNLD